ncbi:Ribosomal protein-like protein [Thalictrum thalictroides]|uniref:Ribosomal protein-like protein n=1 Tax=Thalictrum thalictroides TaxID=46969 RepID=A0A7J6VA38_THATH|nr:Ribosomal protein-like protein [Thalictrum thalictroides]
MASSSPIALPPTPISLQSSSSSTEPITQKKKLPQIPTPQELVSHYESQGMETNEASMKVIEDLQNVLVRVVSSGRGKKDKFMVESSRKLETVHTRLAILELKLDSKPGYGESLALGVAAGTLVKGIGSVVPHVFGAIGQMWNAVKSSTKA